MNGVGPDMLGKALLEGIKQVPGLVVVAYIALQAFSLFDSQSDQMATALERQSAAINKNTEVLTEVKTLLMMQLRPQATPTDPDQDKR